LFYSILRETSVIVYLYLSLCFAFGDAPYLSCESSPYLSLAPSLSRESSPSATRRRTEVQANLSRTLASLVCTFCAILRRTLASLACTFCASLISCAFTSLRRISRAPPKANSRTVSLVHRRVSLRLWRRREMRRERSAESLVSSLDDF